MSNFMFASIGRKFIISLSGIFLMIFILVHLTVNLLLIFDDSGELFNQGANFMATNPVIKIVEPLLGLGFMIHILWSFMISYQNWKARPIPYNKKDARKSSTWASRNMLILGAMILVFLIIHIINFFWKIKFEPHNIPDIAIGKVIMENTYSLVSNVFITSTPYSIFYIIGAILLGLHLTHGFWSSFQTLGFNNDRWMKRLEWIARIYAVIVAVGFSAIPLYFMIKF